ncbi:MAG: Ig-like domain-containing protein [Methylobacter sp.]|uniref:Ig-like domain-containing protein n=1 Tax=Methylobacter sp. TaxID=2051955 RepID=UPI00258695BD|nr:Ig-like domain-containing protein [Methylobacter sp.]MCL7420197.1 Ig-like domain-containing protein [Methylobacter sp.]
MTNRKTLFKLSALGALLLAGQHPALAADITGSLIRTIDTSAFNPPSPDPSGIAYLSDIDRLLICDGEVNEMNIYAGANLFEMTRTGVLQGTSNTLSYSEEPVGCAFNTDNGHLLISSDDDKAVYDINPGPDGQLFTSDDTRTSFSTRTLCDSSDPEGIAYGEGTLFIIDGVNAEVYKVTPGPDGLFNGSGETCTHFDTSSLGVTDPEGGEYDPDNPGHLYIVGKPKEELAYLTTSGTLVRTIGIGAANPVKPAGLAAVSKNITGDNTTHVYVADRGIDNDPDPNENDGKVYQFSIPTGTQPGNQAPTVAAGPDQFISASADALLDGTVADDGLPNPPGQVTTTWSKVSGPGTVTFGNASAVDTTASFSSPGVYVLRLTASDSQLSGSDDVQINVQSQPSPFAAIYVSTVSSGTVNGIAFGDEDILAYDTANGTWSLYFDGSDVGLGASGVEVDAFHIMPDGSILLSFAADGLAIPNVGTVDDSDIVRFIPTSLGTNTAGSFEWYFDGSDVELTASDEDVDAIGFAPDGRLLISTTGNPTVTGVSGANDEDMLAFTPTSLGEATSGTWALYFDGSDVELSQSSSEDVNGVAIDDNGDIYLTTLGTFSVTGANGGGADIFQCSPSSTGSNTACNYAFVWNGIGSGLPSGAVVNGIDLTRTASGGGGGGSDDTTAPTVSLTAPTNGATVLGTVTVSANASDNVGVVGVQFRLDGVNLGAEDTSSPYSIAWDTTAVANGSHSLTAVARDAAGNIRTSDAVTVTVDNSTGGGGGGSGSLDIRVSASTDDAEEIISTGKMDLKSSDLEMILDSDGDQTVGMRFNAITIPQGATITSAFIQFTVDEAESGATTLQIAGQSIDNAPTFTTGTGNISSRPKTGTSVSWSPAAWPTKNVAGPDQRTPNIAAVIQEIVNRAGWSSGNSLAVIITGNGERVAEAFDGVPSAAPLLHVEYTAD